MNSSAAPVDFLKPTPPSESDRRSSSKDRENDVEKFDSEFSAALSEESSVDKEAKTKVETKSADAKTETEEADEETSEGNYDEAEEQAKEDVEAEAKAQSEVEEQPEENKAQTVIEVLLTTPGKEDEVAEGTESSEELLPDLSPDESGEGNTSIGKDSSAEGEMLTAGKDKSVTPGKEIEATPRSRQEPVPLESPVNETEIIIDGEQEGAISEHHVTSGMSPATFSSMLVQILAQEPNEAEVFNTPISETGRAIGAVTSQRASVEVRSQEIQKLPDVEALRASIEETMEQTSNLPKRVTFELKTPPGALVTLHLTRVGGQVRAQLAANDGEVMRWLNQEIQKFKMMDAGQAIRWLPAQMENMKSETSTQQRGQRDFKDSGRQSSDYGTSDVDLPEAIRSVLEKEESEVRR